VKPPTTAMVFIFDFARELILLVRKKRPARLAGKLNPPGGHIEKGETPLVAAVREVGEETGMFLSGTPRLFAVVDHPEMGVCSMYAIMQPVRELLDAARRDKLTDEPVLVREVEDIISRVPQDDYADDLPWLVQLALPAAAMDWRTPLPVFDVRIVPPVMAQK